MPEWDDHSEERQPKKVLLLSLLALAVPVVGSATLPDLVAGDFGLLLWILPVLPAFLLSYYHGWRGASAALAAGMAVFAITNAALMWAGRTTPPPSVLLGVTVVLVTASLGSGWIAESYRASLRHIRSEALTDAGTGLPNRRAVMMFLERSFAAASRGGRLCVVLFDLDRFKNINDEHGHAVGDEVLRRFGGILEDITRAMNISGRYGGEEFLSVVDDADAEGATVFAERVTTAVEEGDFPVHGVTVSAGVAQYEAGMAASEVLVAAADQALYRAKRNGRNRVESLRPAGRRADVVREPSTDQTSTVPRGSGQRVLVVDDDHAARSGMARSLRRLGYSVLEAALPERALQIVRGLHEPLDLVVSDIEMPGIRGFRLIEMMQEFQADLRVVYVSGHSQDEVDWAGVPGAAWAFISKPLLPEELARKVADVLHRSLVQERISKLETDVRLTEPAPAGHLEFRPPFLESVSGELDGAVLGARIAVVHSKAGWATGLLDILVRSGFANVHALSGSDRMLPDGWDLVCADLTAGGVTVRSLTASRERPGQAPAPLLLVTGEEAVLVRADLLGGGLVEVLRRPVDRLLVASTARNLLRIGLLQAQLDGIQESAEASLVARAAELEESRAEVLRRLASIAEYRDELTAEHAERVGRIAATIAEALRWAPEHFRLIEEAAILHDVGKVAVPDTLLRKPDKLTESERILMQQHTVVGAELLAGSRNPLLSMAGEIALSHHERWDGHGYPRERVRTFPSRAASLPWPIASTRSHTGVRTASQCAGTKRFRLS